MNKGKQFGNIYLSFQAKPPHKTWALVINHPRDVAPTEIIEVFEAIGWEHSFYAPADHNGMTDTIMSKKGRGVFSSWTPRQNITFMKLAEMALKELGFEDVPRIKLTIHDLI
jgi:hypothetical protein